MVSLAEVSAVQRLYPQVYLACHVDHVRRKSTRHGLTSQEASLLAHLDRDQPQTARQLARHLGVAASTLSAALQRLERAACIQRQNSPSDRRVAQLRLTEQGAAALAATSVLNAERVRAVLEMLDAPTRAQALQGLGLLAEGARRWQEKKAPRRSTPG